MQRHIAYLLPTTSIEPQNQNTKHQFPTHFRHVTITNKPYDIVHVQPWNGIFERNLRRRSTRNLSIARVVNPKPIPKNLDKLPPRSICLPCCVTIENLTLYIWHSPSFRTRRQYLIGPNCWTSLCFELRSDQPGSASQAQPSAPSPPLCRPRTWRPDDASPRPSRPKIQRPVSTSTSLQKSPNNNSIGIRQHDPACGERAPRGLN